MHCKNIRNYMDVSLCICFLLCFPAFLLQDREKVHHEVFPEILDFYYRVCLKYSILLCNVFKNLSYIVFTFESRIFFSRHVGNLSLYVPNRNVLICWRTFLGSFRQSWGRVISFISINDLWTVTWFSKSLHLLISK